MPPVRAVGRKLFPSVEPECCDLVPLPDQLESLPGYIQDAVKKGVQIALRDMPPIATSRAPNEYPPFVSEPVNQTVEIVSGGQNTSLAVAQIIAALKANTSPQVSGAKYPIVDCTGFNNVTPQELIPFLVLLAGDYERVHFSGVEFGVSSIDAYTALAFTVMIDGETVLDRVSLLDLAELSIDAPPSSRIVFYIANRDADSAFLVYFSVRGWRYTCQDQGNSFSNTVLRQDGAWEEPNDPCVPPRRRLRGGIFGPCSTKNGNADMNGVTG